MSTDPSKVETIMNWPKPKNIKGLQGFVGLTGYYRRFIKNCGNMNKHPNSLIKKNACSGDEKKEKLLFS